MRTLEAFRAVSYRRFGGHHLPSDELLGAASCKRCEPMAGPLASAGTRKGPVCPEPDRPGSPALVRQVCHLGPSRNAGLRDPMAELTGPGPERYHAKPRIARRRLSEPGYRHRHHVPGGS